MVPSNMFKPSINYLPHSSKVVVLFLDLVLLYMFRVCLSFVCPLQPCNHMLRRVDLLALLCVEFCCILSLSPWVGGGT